MYNTVELGYNEDEGSSTFARYIQILEINKFVLYSFILIENMRILESVNKSFD